MYKNSKLNEFLTSPTIYKNIKFNEFIEKAPFQNINTGGERLKITKEPMLQTEKRKYEDILEIAINDFTDDPKHESTLKSQTLLNNYFSNYQETSFETVKSKQSYNVEHNYERLSSDGDFNMTEFSPGNAENAVKSLLKQASFEVEILSNSPVSTGCNCTFYEECSKCNSLIFQLTPSPKGTSKPDFQKKKKIKELQDTSSSMLNKISLSKSRSNLNHCLSNFPNSNKLHKTVEKVQPTSLKRYFSVIKAPDTKNQLLNDRNLKHFTASDIKTNKNNLNILKPKRRDISFSCDQLNTSLKYNTEISQTKNIDYASIKEKSKLVYEPVPINNNENYIKPSIETSSHSKTIIEDQYSDNYVFPLFSNIENYIFEDQSCSVTKSNPQNILSQDNKPTSFDVQFTTILKTIPSIEKDQIFQEGLKKITENEYLIYNPLYDNIPRSTNKEFILNQIEKLMSGILNDFVRKESGPSFKIRCFKWSNCKYIDDRLKLNKREDSRYIIVRYQSLASQVKFNVILYILGKSYSLVKTNCFCTKREIYYQTVNYVDCQERINDAVNSVSCLLGVPPWELGVLASSKGLVFGNLEITLTSGDKINFSNKGGTLIPQNPTAISTIKTNASFILVIEKDSIYQKLLDENCLNKLSSSFILITGKGYPDTNTRLFLKILWMKSLKPAFILTDADPHGIDIMLTYRFGSLNSSHLSNYLALPNLRWLGILPSEIISFDIKGQPLSARDQSKIKSLLDRPYFQAGANPQIKKEIEKLQEKNVKAEIEGIMKTDNFLSDVYLPNKFFTQNFI